MILENLTLALNISNKFNIRRYDSHHDDSQHNDTLRDDQIATLSMKTSTANIIKLLSVIYEFSHKARVFVRIGRKSLPGTNTSL